MLMENGTGMMPPMGMMMMMMKSYFHVGDEETILFLEAHTLSTGAMVGACFVIFAVGMLYEGIKFARDYLLQRQIARRASRSMVVNHQFQDSGPMAGVSKDKIIQQPDMTVKSALEIMFSLDHFVQTVLNTIQVFISYCLMLVVMTYNVWLALAVFLGVGVGYCVFGWTKAVRVEEDQCG